MSTETRTAQTVLAEIKEIDARITERFEESDESDSGEYRLDEYNADDREAIHGLAMKLVGLLEKALPVIEEALGDAYAYRTESGEVELDELDYDERAACERYEALAEQLSITIS